MYFIGLCRTIAPFFGQTSAHSLTRIPHCESTHWKYVLQDICFKISPTLLNMWILAFLITRKCLKSTGRSERTTTFQRILNIVWVEARMASSSLSKWTVKVPIGRNLMVCYKFQHQLPRSYLIGSYPCTLILKKSIGKSFQGHSSNFFWAHVISIHLCSNIQFHFQV